MAGIGLLVLLRWGVSWLSILLVLIGAACVAAAVYAWFIARRAGRLLDRPWSLHWNRGGKARHE